MGAFTWATSEAEALRDQIVVRQIVRICSAKGFGFNAGLAIGTAYHEDSGTALAVGVKFDSRGWCERQTLKASLSVGFPYLSGLLAYRVGPAVCKLLDDHVDEVDLLLFDGQGVAHPRGVGLAAHIGALYDKPAIGITRHNLYGDHIAPPSGWFNRSELRDPKTGYLLGFAVSLGVLCDPCYVSPGHRFDAESAMEIVKRVSRRGDCLPRPIRRAHADANLWARNYQT